MKAEYSTYPQDPRLTGLNGTRPATYAPYPSANPRHGARVSKHHKRSRGPLPIPPRAMISNYKYNFVPDPHQVQVYNSPPVYFNEPRAVPPHRPINGDYSNPRQAPTQQGFPSSEYEQAYHCHVAAPGAPAPIPSQGHSRYHQEQPTYISRKQHPQIQQIRTDKPSKSLSYDPRRDLTQLEKLHILQQMRSIEQQYVNERKYQDGIYHSMSHAPAESLEAPQLNGSHVKVETPLSTPRPVERSSPISPQTPKKPKPHYDDLIRESKLKWSDAIRRLDSFISLKLSDHRLEYWLAEHRKCCANWVMIRSHEMAQTENIKEKHHRSSSDRYGAPRN